MNHQLLTKSATVIACAILFYPKPAPAATAVSNLASPTFIASNPNDFDAGGGNRSGVEYAQSFMTGALAATLNSITVHMGNDGGGGGFRLQLWNDISSLPASALLTLSGNPNPATLGFYTYTGSLALSPNTTYWVVEAMIHTAPDDVYAWQGASTQNETGAPGWSIGNSAATRNVNNGIPASWSTFGPIHQISVDATIVPEPASSFLVIFGAVAVLCGRKRP